MNYREAKDVVVFSLKNGRFILSKVITKPDIATTHKIYAKHAKNAWIYPTRSGLSSTADTTASEPSASTSVAHAAKHVVECMMNVLIKNLLARAKAGDAEAMEEILLRFDRLICKVLIDHGVVDEDLAQEVREEFMRKVRRRTEKIASHAEKKPAP